MAAVPDALRRALERELGGHDRAELRAATVRLMTTYQREEPANSSIVRNELDALAYAAYRLPATFAAARHVFQQVAAVIAPASLLDLGGGSGAAAWAAVDSFPTLERVTVHDQSSHAIEIGRRLRHGVPGHEWEWTVGDALHDPGITEMVVLAYVIGELTAAQRGALVGHLLDASATIAVIEPGTPSGFERIIEVRGQLIEAGWHIAAPCPHAGTCPWSGESRDWCHMQARVQRLPLQRDLKGGSVGHEDEKFAYVVASRDPVAQPAGRIVRHPLTRKGMVELQVCEASGEVEKRIISKRHGPLYREARNADWGDPWPGATDRADR